MVPSPTRFSSLRPVIGAVVHARAIHSKASERVVDMSLLSLTRYARHCRIAAARRRRLVFRRSLLCSGFLPRPTAAPWRRRVSHHVDEEQRRPQLFAGGGWVPVRIFPAEQLLPGLQALVRAAAGGISAALATPAAGVIFTD